ncbi:glycine betaine/L-proline ABC transporter substrate-binding protein ProX [Microcoleus sp. MOSTC5]|uniref:glycine betaine/L-proline ABC transporter substrate-binding protein ProX n=1 Tax=Microcoleus sp. MOSTC5 TaxID=3055378 RepID=UPI002FD5B164
MKLHRKKPIFAIAVALIVGLISCQSTPESTTKSPGNSRSTEVGLPGKGVKVRPGSGTSVTGQFVSEILRIGLEKLGYEVEELKQLNTTALFLALGNDEIDVTPILEKVYANFFEKAGGEKKLQVVGMFADSEILQGYSIDKKTAEQYKITNLVQLKDPKLAQLFDSDGDGKANLTGCNPGLTCELIIDRHLKVYGLEDTVKQDKGEIEVLKADIITRYQQGKPVLYYSWNLSWLTSVLQTGKDVVWLEVPFTSLPGEKGKEVTQKDTTAGGKNLGFAVDKGRIAASQQFLESNPAAKRWFELVRVPFEDIITQEKLAHEGKSRPKDIRRHAEEWVKNHQALVDGWLEEARIAGKASK